MRQRRSSGRALGIGASSLPVALAVLLALGGAARADDHGGGGDDHGRKVRGDLSSHGVTAGCTSPVGLCLAGTVTGGLAGTFSYSAASLTVTNGVGVFLGTTLLHTARGDLTEQNQTTANLTTGQYVDVITIVGETGAWTGCTGTVTALGTFDFANDTGSNEYTGRLHCPEVDDDDHGDGDGG